LSLTALPRPPSWFRGGAPGERREGRGGRRREGVPECPNPELASLVPLHLPLYRDVCSFEICAVCDEKNTKNVNLVNQM